MVRKKSVLKIYDNAAFIGKIIKNARDKMHWTQAQLAEYAELSDKNIGSIENGKQFPHLTNFLRLLELLPLSIEDFGITEKYTTDKTRELLLEKIYTSNSIQAKKYLEALNFVDKISSIE